MPDDIMKLPYGFVPDWFLDELDREELPDEMTDAKARMVRGVSESVLNSLVVYMKHHNIYFATDRPAEPGPPKSARCSVRNGVPLPGTTEGRGFCPECGNQAILKQNGRLPVHWLGTQTELNVMRSYHPTE